MPGQYAMHRQLLTRIRRIPFFEIKKKIFFVNFTVPGEIVPCNTSQVPYQKAAPIDPNITSK